MGRPHLKYLVQLPHFIRFRLTLWYTGLVALVLATFVGSVFYAFSHYQFDTYDDEITRVLTAALQQHVQVAFVPHCAPAWLRGKQDVRDQACYAFQTQVYVRDPKALDTGGASIQYMTEDGRPLTDIFHRPSSPPRKSPLNTKVAQAQVQVARSGRRAAASSGAFRFIAVPFTFEGTRIIGQIAAPMTRVQGQVDRLKHILIYAAGILLLIAAVGGWVLAGRALKPIDEITRRAQQITVHDLSQRLDLHQEDELGRMAATFDDMIARLQEAFERQKRFTSDASHELRTPLTVMQADLSLALARPRSADEYRQTLVSMDEEVIRLSAIVNDLLMLTRIDVDPAGMQYSPVVLDEMLQDLTARVGVIAVERGITVRADRIDAVTISGDAIRLRQLFTNLLDNAVTYTLSGGVVTWALERTRDGARVTVSDTGIGIAPEHAARIFERFYRTGEAREHNAKGTGLGLAISRSVVQAHHGDITVQSMPGQGTTFTVTLPLDGRKRVRRAHLFRVLAASPAAR